MSEVARARLGTLTMLTPSEALNRPQSLAALREALRSCMEDQERAIAVDMVRVPVVNGEALELLLDARDELVRAGGSLRLTHTSAAVDEVLRITGLASRLKAVERAPRSAAPARPRRIGEILLARRAVSEAQIAAALEVQRATGRRMAQVLVDKGELSEKDLLLALSEQLDVPFAQLRPGLYDPAAASLVDAEVARRLSVLPLFRVRGTLFLATSDPQSLPSLETVEELSGSAVKPVLACRSDLLQALEDAYASGRDLAEYMGHLESDLELIEAPKTETAASLEELAAGSPIIALINGVIQRAVRDGASDVHLEPGRSRARIRLRVDGVLYPIMTPPLEVHPALVSRLKVMANLDIAERRRPQDGRVQVATGGRVVDLRFSSLPGIYGEKVVLRVLDKQHSILDVERLGLWPGNLERFKALLRKSFGLVLVTGPTGSGKTTTLYAAINNLNSTERNIVTIEDPVEYQIDGITQNPVREDLGLGFATFLKHVLRQDPDVIMVGEIRERETAEIAVQAALTGHLVLSTLHTNDAVSAVSRMLDMGIEPFLLASALSGVVAQRLVRTVCASCKTGYVVQGESLRSHGVPAEDQVRLLRGRGCAACYDSGYKGRVAIHEILESDVDLQQLIVSHPARADLDRFVASKHVRTLVQDGIERAMQGATTVEEVLRVTSG